MKKPMFISKFIAQIFLICALVFFVCGLLSIFGVMTPSETSKIQGTKEMGVVFCMISVLLSFVSMICQRIGNKKRRIHDCLLKTGHKIQGTMERVERAPVKFGGSFSYRICYSYTKNGKKWSRKSHLLWDIPALKVQEKIDVYVDENGNAAIDF